MTLQIGHHALTQKWQDAVQHVMPYTQDNSVRLQTASIMLLHLHDLTQAMLGSGLVWLEAAGTT